MKTRTEIERDFNNFASGNNLLVCMEVAQDK
jgi:hypothetical protein